MAIVHACLGPLEDVIYLYAPERRPQGVRLLGLPLALRFLIDTTIPLATFRCKNQAPEPDITRGPT